MSMAKSSPGIPGALKTEHPHAENVFMKMSKNAEVTPLTIKAIANPCYGLL